jgi:hypothetical protein
MTRLLTLLCFICVVALNVVADTKETVTIDGSAVDKFVSQLTFNGSDVVLAFDDQSSQTVAANTVSIDFTYDSADPTGIAGIHDDTNITGAVQRVFSLSGQLIGDTTTGLPEGIYIVNDKKVLIK